jgi:NAD(P)-dependent dehydrogenase (short-subunit alcohol dehydrogenase family)
MGQSWLSGKGCIVTLFGTDVGFALAAALSQRRARVALLTDTLVSLDSDVMRVPVAFESRSEIEGAFERACTEIGPVACVVHSAAPSVSRFANAVECCSYEEWEGATHAALRSTIYCFQAAHNYFKDRGGSIVAFGPVVSLVGASGLVPLATALEAERALAKSAARQWGPKGIRVNWLALANEHYSELRSAAIPSVPEAGVSGPPVGYVPELASDVANAVEVLASPAAAAITGATINLDGGNWMVP